MNRKIKEQRAYVKQCEMVRRDTERERSVCHDTSKPTLAEAVMADADQPVQ